MIDRHPSRHINSIIPSPCCILLPVPSPSAPTAHTRNLHSQHIALSFFFSLEEIVKEENIGSIRIDFHVLPTKATELSRFEPDSRTRTDYYLVVTLVYRRSRPLSAGQLIRPLHFFCLTSLQTLQQRESYQLLPLQIAGIGFSRIYLKLLLRATPFSTRTRPRIQ